MKNNYLKVFTFLLVLITSYNHTYSQIVNNNSELQTAITNASAGTTITLANGTWTDVQININKNGTETNPVTIQAETPGSVFFEGNSRVSMGGSYIIFEGVVFQNPSNLDVNGSTIEPVIELRDSSNNECDNCTITNIKIDNYNGTAAQELLTFKWIIVYGQYNEISFCSFEGKYGIGSIINDNRNATSTEFAEPDFTKIHHNYFADRTPVGVVNDLNDQDAIRIGNSSTSLHPSNTEVYDNLFYNWSGEVEIISNKSGENKYYNNTFRDYQGTLTLRHGDDCEVYNNFFFAENNLFSGGIRVIGEGHKIYNNYIEGVNSEKPDGGNTKTAGAINVSNGQENSPLNRYFQVKDAIIVNNTFVNCDYGFRIGTSVSSNPVLTLAPENLVIANNIMINTEESAVDEQTAPIGSSIYQGNITQNGAWDLTTGTNNNQVVTNGLLENGTLYYELGSNSPAIDAAVGSYPFVTTDILGGNRSGNLDAGAEEFNSGGSRIPYTTADVGVSIGFGGTGIDTPRLTTNTISINVARSSGNTLFDIDANVDWTITDNADWLTLDITSGSNSAIITANFTENTSSAQRTATITISEVAGGSDLTTMLTIIQSNIFSEEITIVDATAIGTEPGKPNVGPQFAWDNNVTEAEYWTGDANTEPEVSITFDLSCIRVLSEIGIHVLKADERTINFDIAVSDDQTGPFASILTGQDSMIETGAENTEQFFNLNNATGRYVKFTSNGNSTGSGFASIVEVNIYGDTTCDATLGVDDNLLSSKGILLYPIPAKNQPIVIESNTIIGKVEVFDLHGRLMLKKEIDSNIGQLEISNLSTGTYIAKIQGAYGRFIIQ
ncbi:T9SS C-terminal target domain-containing protein [Aquimarina sp. AD1]|uniref:chondroitinase-B domain-containing protein n=1 Tax=Aquimarina sp. (strain AD1) TaxID=1714848 RepID=UPI000E5577D5|nr:chondroitinase-B domain-containing protein [Aquimarina sp. AD1]AXT58247.1 T9SS C-terminal target domain-containing protein [Aquimarina sp. AD1]RKN15639.1 T9SS C-terminal target domain-containing protein [Aquimarina sp. AD1]